MGRIEAVQGVLGHAIEDAINQTAITAKGEIYRGYPGPDELRDMMNAKAWIVSIVPTSSGGRAVPARGYQHRYFTVTPAGIVGLITSTGVTFSGTVHAGVNVRVFVKHPLLGVKSIPYHTAAGDTLATVATAIAAGINALPAPAGATASGASVAVSGVSDVHCNIGSTGSVAREVARYEQMLDVAVYAASAYDPTGGPNDNLRSLIVDAIMRSVGTKKTFDYDLGDGTSSFIRQSTPPVYKDNSQTDFGVFEAHIVCKAQYPVLDVEQATQLVENRVDKTIARIYDSEIFAGG